MNNVIVVATHPDDEVLGCAGAIQYHKSIGDTVYCYIVANRVINHIEDHQYLSDLKNSILNVKKILGIDDVVYAGMRDEQLDGLLLIDLIVPIEEYIRKIGPMTVYIPNDKDTDQDHRAVANSCKVSCSSVQNVFAYEVYGPSKNFIPNYYIELTQNMLNKKIDAMKCYSGEMREYPHPRSEQGIRILSQARGIEVGLNIAEAFRVLRYAVKLS